MKRIEKITFEDDGYAYVLVDEDDYILEWFYQEELEKENARVAKHGRRRSA